MADRIGVIGAGIVGLAVARRLGEGGGRAELTVLDKEDRVGAHQTGHNSGVAHAGLYYTPGSLKARLCRRGLDLMRDFCAERAIPYEECGKVVAATEPAEMAPLTRLAERAQANDVPGLRWLE